MRTENWSVRVDDLRRSGIRAIAKGSRGSLGKGYRLSIGKTAGFTGTVSVSPGNVVVSIPWRSATVGTGITCVVPSTWRNPWYSPK